MGVVAGTVRSLDAGERVAGVNLVDHDLHVQRIAAGGIGGPRVVAHHAILDFDARAAVRGQGLVTGVARGRVDDLAAENTGGRAGGRLEGVRRVVGLGEAADFEPDPVGQGGVVDHFWIVGDVLLERVLISAVAVVDECACGRASTAPGSPGWWRRRERPRDTWRPAPR